MVGYVAYVKVLFISFFFFPMLHRHLNAQWMLSMNGKQNFILN